MLPKMNKQILLVGNFYSRSNASRRTRQVCEDLAVHLPDVGWDVICTSGKRSRLARLIDKVWTTWGDRSKFSVAQVDVFRSPAFRWAEAVCWTLRRARKPYVLTLRSGDLPELARRHPRRVARLLRSAAAVTAPSRYLVDQMRHYRSDVILLPNPLDLGRYQFTVRERPRPTLTWLRAFKRLYNPSLAIQVVALLKSQFPDVHLTMIGPDVGDGSFAESRRLADEVELADRVHFPGRVPKDAVPAWMSQGDIFLNTTNVDNTPVSVLEAMACGLCVVSTNVGGIPYLLEHEYDSLLVAPNDPDAMAAAVSRLLTEPTLAEQLSRNAHEKVKRFDWSVVLPQWDSLLTTVAEGRRT